MNYANEKELRERIEHCRKRPFRAAIEVQEDTSNYMQIAPNAVLRLQGDDYFVLGDATEGRFGIDDQPKFWVKRVIDLETGANKFIKLVFHESFEARFGMFRIRCMRNPDKESRVLDRVGDDPRFMHGRTVTDVAGNNVRIIDEIQGSTLFARLNSIDQSHEQYFHETLPEVFAKLLVALEGLDFLQSHQLHHGDVRNDHLIIDAATGDYRWIDFDYEVNFLDYDVWSVGNVLTFVTGKGMRTHRDIKTLGLDAARFNADDFLLFFGHRLANLKKMFPYIPEPLNDLLMRFSASTTHCYEDFASIIADLRAVQPLLGRT